MDYISTPITATFPAGATSVTIDVPVTVDNIVEQKETFDISFTIPSSLSDQVSPGKITEAVGAIQDNTSKFLIKDHYGASMYVLLAATVMFSESMYSVNEDCGSVQIGLALSNPLSSDITVEIFTTDGSATGEYCSILINY